jgi:AraC-like DNA-binding protein
MALHKERFRRPAQTDAAGQVRPVFTDFHLLWMDGDYEYPRHQHTNYETILVEQGPYYCELNSTELTVSPGAVLIIKPGDWHQDHLRRGQRHYVLHFQLAAPKGAPAPPPLFRTEVAATAQICHGHYADEAWFLRELRREAEGAAPHAAAVQDGLLSALFWRLVRGLEPAALSPGFRRLPEDEAERETIAHAMRRHLAHNLDVPTLARELRLSPRHLTNRCRALFGQPPARLFLRMKLETAAELLRASDARVKEVAESLGFANPYHFSAAFRRHFGHPPSALGRERERPRGSGDG